MRKSSLYNIEERAKKFWYCKQAHRGLSQRRSFAILGQERVFDALDQAVQFFVVVELVHLHTGQAQRFQLAYEVTLLMRLLI